jgi:hypothetical protein
MLLVYINTELFAVCEQTLSVSTLRSVCKALGGARDLKGRSKSKDVPVFN